MATVVPLGQRHIKSNGTTTTKQHFAGEGERGDCRIYRKEHLFWDANSRWQSRQAMLNDAKVHFQVSVNGFVLIVGNVFPGAMIEVVKSPQAHSTKTVLGGLVELE